MTWVIITQKLEFKQRTKRVGPALANQIKRLTADSVKKVWYQPPFLIPPLPYKSLSPPSIPFYTHTHQISLQAFATSVSRPHFIFQRIISLPVGSVFRSLSLLIFRWVTLVSDSVFDLIGLLFFLYSQTPKKIRSFCFLFNLWPNLNLRPEQNLPPFVILFFSIRIFLLL